MDSLVRPLLRAHEHVEPITNEEVAMAYSGAKRTKYLRAAASLVERDVDRHDARVSMFIKADKLDLQDGSEKRGCPRAIQFRSTRYACRLGAYLRPIEKRLYNVKGTREFGVRRSRLCAKGLNAVQRARLIQRKWAEFDRPVCISLDAVRFDRCVSVQALRCEHSAYLMFNRDAELKRLLAYQLTNSGRTMSGIQYKLPGNRMSGDFNTGLGNSLLSMSLMLAYCRRVGLTKFDFLVDGDDCLLFVERPEAPLATREPEAFERYGFNFEFEEPAYVLEDIVFGRSRMVKVGEYRLLRDYRRAVSTSFVSHQHYSDLVGGRRLAATVARAEWNVHVGVPVLGAFYYAASKALAGTRLMSRDVLRHRLKLETFGLEEDAPWVDPGPEARHSFWLAFGLDPEEQACVEARLAADVAKCRFDPMNRQLDLPLFSDCPLAMCFSSGW